VIRALTHNDPQMLEAVLDRMRGRESPDSIANWVHSTGPPVTPNKPSRIGLGDAHLVDLKTVQGGPVRRDGISAVSYSSPGYQRPGPRLSFSSHSPDSTDAASRRSFSTETSPTSRRNSRPTPLPRFATSFGTSSILAPAFPEALPMAAQPCIAGILPLTGLDCPIWTCVTPDTQLVHRLVTRVFAGDFCSLPLISRQQFMKDFYEGSRPCCSESLVNAILGWGCSLLDAPSQLISQVSFNDAFLGEAKLLLSAEPSHTNLPSIQALGVLAWAEISRGNGEEAWNLVQESVRSSIHLSLSAQCNDNPEGGFRDARALTYCGGFTLMRCVPCWLRALLLDFSDPKQ
jgi:hypothetical protein